MTPEQIKELAKQAGGTPYIDRYYPDVVSVAFDPVALAVFVGLVRESALDEAETQCRQLADCEENTQDYRNGAAWCAERIKSLKK